MAPSTSIAGCRVLIVDHDAISARLLDALFAAERCFATVTKTSAAALNHVRDNGVDAILVKLELEGGRGIELVSKLRAFAPSSQSLLLGMTANPAVFSEKIAVTAGCDAWLTLPIDTRTLATRIGDALSRRRAG